MLTLSLSVFITQIVAFLGVAAAARLVILVACFLKDLDIRLMYHENIFRHLGYYKNYDTSHAKKCLVAWMSLLGLLVAFTPTYLSLANTKDTEHVTYTNIHTSNLMTSLGSSTTDERSKPVFTEFYDTSKHTPANSTGALLENYLMSRKHQTRINPSGVWYNPPSGKFTQSDQKQGWRSDNRYPMNPQALNGTTGVFSVRYEDKESPRILYYSWPDKFKKAYALSYNNKASKQGSSTLESCADNDSLGSNIVTNITTIDGHQVQGARSMNRTCYPITDPSLWLITFQESDNDTGADSLLNSKEDLYFRSVSLGPQATASYSMGIVARNWKKLRRIVSMVKKSVHITVFYSDLNRPLTPDNCSSLSYTNLTTFNQDVNMISCQLVSLAKQNPELPILQATRRSYTANRTINSVYTYIKTDKGHGIMIDLTLYYALFAKESADKAFDPEIFIAYQQVKKRDFNTTDFAQLVQSINPYPDLDTDYGFYTATDLVLLGVRLSRLLSFNDKMFLKTTARVISAVRVSTVWIVLNVSLTAIFILIIIASTFMTPEAYKTDLRSLLVHTLIAQEYRIDSNTPMLQRENAGFLTRKVDLQLDAALKMDNVPIVLSENIPM
ncbi:hypothetical protein MBANPS3_010670, partial [Mucor bainieri]